MRHRGQTYSHDILVPARSLTNANCQSPRIAVERRDAEAVVVDAVVAESAFEAAKAAAEEEAAKTKEIMLMVVPNALVESNKKLKVSVKEFDELLAELKDKLDKPAIGLSLEAQQKLCIARLLPVKPAVLLMDEPCSALDPKGTEAVEELIWTLRGEYTILIVTHNMAQARRATEECIFMLMGKVVEHSATDKMFLTPEHQETADYIEGRYG